MAAAEVLKAGDNPAQGVKILAAGATAGALVKLAAESALRLIPDIAQWGTYAGKAIIYVGTNVSPALLGVGYIVGLNAGAVVLLGGVIAWNIGIPIYSTFFLDGNPDLAAAVAGASAIDAAGMIRAAQIRYLGVGAMLIGGVWTLFSIRKSILLGCAQRPRRDPRERRRGRGPVRARHPDEVCAHRHRRLHAAARRAVPGNRRPARRAP